MRRGHQVFIHREVGENLALLGYQPQTQTRNFVRRPERDILTGKMDATTARVQDAGSRTHRRGFAHAVTAEQSDKFTFSDRQVHAEQGLGVAVANFNAADAQQVCSGVHSGKASSPR